LKQVSYFSEILICPLEFLWDRKNPIELQNQVEQLLTNSQWKRIFDHYTKDGSINDITAYGEFGYFHPFVRRFLYGEDSKTTNKRSEKDSPIDIYKRDDISKVKITLKGDAVPIIMEVKWAHLYVFDVEVAVLALEICGRDIELSKASDIIKLFRRIYPPFFKERDGIRKAGNCPIKVQFVSDTNIDSNFEDTDIYLNHVKLYKNAPIASHWQELLKPLIIYKTPESLTNVQYRLIGDDRIPFMAYIAVDSPHQISRPDLVRLAFADGKGEGYPYSPVFLADFEEKYCYDRFWDTVTPGYEWMNTRIMCNGYGFIFLGDSKDESFFMNEKDGALSHFRNHYFNMGLIVHFQRSALLLFSDRLADAVKDFNNKDTTVFHKSVREVFETLLKFTHRYWGSEYSNQWQGKDIFNMWKKHLETDRLFNDVMREVRDINQHLDVQEQRKQSKTTLELTLVAAVGLVFTITSGLLGMNIYDVEHKLQFNSVLPLFMIALFFSILVIIPPAIPLLRNLFKRKK